MMLQRILISTLFAFALFVAAIATAGAGKVVTQPGSAKQTEATRPGSYQQARVYTEKDIERLRKAYDLGQGMYANNTYEYSLDEMEETAPSSKDIEENRRKVAALQRRLDQAQKVYDVRGNECAMLKGTVFLRDRIYYKESGHYVPLPFFDTVKKICEEAENAKRVIDQTKSELQALTNTNEL